MFADPSRAKPVPDTFSHSIDPLCIDILLLPETNLILLASVIEPLRGANRIAGEEKYRWRILTPDGGPVETTSHIPIPASEVFRPNADTNPLFVLASYNWMRAASPQLIAQLSRTARHRPFVAGIESGTWLLARAGLLDHFKATTHWEDIDDFTARHPAVDVSFSRFVIDGKRVTTSGSLPTIDLMLELIKCRQVYSLALEVNRLFIYTDTLSDRRSETVTGHDLHVGEPRVAAAIRIMEQTIEQPMALDELASTLRMSARHLQTLFHRTMGVAPHVHYVALRMNAARRRVIETRSSFAEIAVTTGFTSASAFTRCYRSHFGESPSGTRRRMRSFGRQTA